MRILIFSFILIFFWSNKANSQRAGERITYNSEKGIYEVRYWSIGDSTYYTVPLFPGNKINPEIKATIDSNDEQYIYKYSLANSDQSLRELYTFSIPVESSISEIKSPNQEWRGDLIGWKKMIRWVQSNSKSDTLGILPGNRVDGEFIFKSESIPGIITVQISSFWGLGNTKDEGPTSKLRAEVDSLLEANKALKLKTIGPRKRPDDIGNNALLDTLRSYRSFSCDTTWITNRGICRSLQAKLDNVAKQLGRGKTKQAVNGLNAFLNEVAAQRGKHISSEGYGLLWFNGLHLLERLGGQRPDKGNKPNKNEPPYR